MHYLFSMSSLNQQFSPPGNWQDFERMCFDLYRGIWKDENAQMHGRSGQKQVGVDIYGVNTNGLQIGVQCKGKNGGYGHKLSKKELKDEVEKAKKFLPPLDMFIIATTAPNDTAIQALAREISKTHAKSNLFEVQVAGWDTLRQLLVAAPAVALEHLSIHVNAVVVEKLDGLGKQLDAATQSDTTQFQAIMAKLEAMTAVSATAGREPPGDAADEPLRQRIKDAVNLGNDGHAQAALASLNALRAQEWDNASPRNRHRLLNAIGFVQMSLDQMSVAAATLRQAHAVDPGKPWSLSALAFAEFLDGNHERAFLHAREALAADPSVEQAAIALIHCADRATVSLPALAGLVPEKLRNNSQVLLALSAAAHARDDDASALVYAEQAHAAEPDNWRTQGVLAHELIKPVLALEGIVLTRLIPPEMRAPFERGLDLLRKAWEAVSGTSFGHRTTEFALNLSSGLDVLGREDEAETILDAALAIRADAPFLLQRKAVLCSGRGDWAGALARLGGIPDDIQEPEAKLAKARALLGVGKAAEAIATARGLAEGSPPARITEAGAAIALEARVDLGDVTDEEVLAVWGAHPKSVMMRAAILDFVKQREALKAAAIKDVLGLLDGSDELDDRDAAMSATVLRVLGEPSRAADLLAGLTSPDRDTSLLHDRLRCLLAADRRREARALFESLSAAIQALPHYVHLGAHLYERVGLLSRARALLERHIEANPGDLQARLSWVMLCHRSDDAASARRWLESVDGGIEGSPRELMSLAHAIDHYLGDPKCWRIGYRALRAGFNDQQVHLGYSVGLFLTGRTSKAGLPDPEVVGPDTAVLLTAVEGTASLVRIIETEADPRLERNEIAPDDGFAKRLTGLCVGDRIGVPDAVNGTTEFAVVSIRSKYLQAHFEVMERFKDRFPESMALASVSVGEDGDPEQFEQVFTMVRRRSEAMRDLDARYREGGLPLAFVAKLAGHSALNIWEELASGQVWSVRCAVGSQEERERAFEALRGCKTCVVDPVTLHMISVLGLAETIRSSVGELAVTQSTRDYLINAALGRRQDCDRGHRGSMKWTGEHCVFQEASEETLLRHAERAEATLALARSCVLVAAEGDAPLSREAKRVFEGMPAAYLDTALAASNSGCVLLCEDMPMRLIAEEATGARGTWLQAAALFGRDNGRISVDACAEATGKLLAARHRFITLGWADFLRELRLHGWLPLGRTEMYFGALAEPGVEIESLNALVAEILTNCYALTDGDWRFRAVCWCLVRIFAKAQPDQVVSLAGAWLFEVERRIRAGAPSLDRLNLVGTTSLIGFTERERTEISDVTLHVRRVVREAYLHFARRETMQAAA